MKLDVKALIAKLVNTPMIVEEGTDGQWTYKKWSDGTYEALYTAGFALNAGTAWAGGYFHKTTYGLPLPSFATSWRLQSAQKSDGVLSWCVGAQEESDGLHFIWQNGGSAAVSGANFVNTIVTITGNWQ